MARVVIENTELKFNVASVVEAAEAVDATAGAEVAMGADQKTLVLVSNTSVDTAADVTVKAGNGLQGTYDYTVEVAAGTTVALCMESGAFKQVRGADAGKMIIIGESDDIEVQCIVLP